jgi:hypothetical protein
LEQISEPVNRAASRSHAVQRRQLVAGGDKGIRGGEPSPATVHGVFVVALADQHDADRVFELRVVLDGGQP